MVPGALDPRDDLRVQPQAGAKGEVPVVRATQPDQPVPVGAQGFQEYRVDIQGLHPVFHGHQLPMEGETTIDPTQGMANGLSDSKF